MVLGGLKYSRRATTRAPRARQLLRARPRARPARVSYSARDRARGPRASLSHPSSPTPDSMHAGIPMS